MKNWYQSKTIWLNLGAILTAVASIATGEVSMQAGIPAVITAVINLGLRFVTTTAIGSSDPAKP